MARIEVHAEQVIILLTAAEKIAAFRTRDIVLDRSAISSALITDDPWVWIRGVRSPGTRIPGKMAIGTWRNHSGRDFVLVRSGRGAVVIDFENASGSKLALGRKSETDDFSRVVISTLHAAELVSALRIDGSDDTVIPAS